MGNYAQNMAAAAGLLGGIAGSYYSSGGKQSSAYRNNISGRTAPRFAYSNTETTTTKRRKKGKGRMTFKKKLMKTEPAKHVHIGDGVNSFALVHNSLYSYCFTKDIVQGTSNLQRLGDDVYLCALKVAMSIQAPNTANGYTYRIIVGYSTQQDSQTPLTSAFTTGIVPNNYVFFPNSGANWRTTGLVNPKSFTTLYDSTIDINSIVSGVGDLKTHIFTVPINQNFEFIAEGGQVGKTRNLYMIIVANVIGGTPGTTACGAIAMNTDLIFKE